MGDARVCVYEAVNETLKEVFVGLTTEGMHKVLTRHRSKGPAEISHWKADHQVSYRIVEPSLAASHASDFAAEHALTLRRPGWKVIAGSLRARPWSRPAEEPPGGLS